MFGFAVLATFVSLALAQQQEWQQCGGIGWTGGTTCASGLTCVVMNPYYSQCLPGTASTTSTVKSTTTVSSTSTSASSTSTSAVKANYWFSFGDSYTTTGFNDSTGPFPSLSNPLGNPAYPGFTGGGGANWVDYLTLNDNTSLIFTWNYAYGGATIDSTLVAPYLPTVLSLTNQVTNFLNGVAGKPGGSVAPWTSQNALFSVWIGINDVGNSFYLSNNQSSFDNTLMDAYFAQVQKLYNAGARNFLFVNVPPTDRSPLMQTGQTAAGLVQLQTVISDFNTKLLSRISTFKSSNTGVTTYVWDAWTAFTQILNNPTAYGFADNTTYGSAPTDFWGNNYHPSSYAHVFFGKDVAAVLKGTIW